MVICCCKRHKGYSLLELMLAMALFVSLAGGLGYAIIRGVNAHSFEASYREATLQTRNALDQMLEEMRTAVVPPETNALAANQRSIPSAVWFPDAYGSSDSVFGSNYKQGLKASQTAGRKDVHVAYNRLLFTRKNPSKENEYVFVDWFIPSTRKDRLYRVVHRMNDKGAVPYEYTSDRYKFKNATSYFGDGASMGDTSSLLFQSNNQADFVVAQLPGGADRLCFAVEHEPNESVYGGVGSSATADRNGAYYNPKLFRVRIKATVYENGNTTYVKDADNKLFDPTDLDPYTTQVTKGYRHKRVVVYNEQAFTEH